MYYILKDWYFQKWTDDTKALCFRVVGSVYERPGWKDGIKLFSSPIRDAMLENDDVIVRTKNSVYHCPVNEHSFPIEDTDLLKRFFDEERRKKIETAATDRYEKYLQTLTDKLPENEKNVLLFVVSALEDHYFKGLLVRREGTGNFISDYKVHIGTFQDSILIGDLKTLDVRFFPLPAGKLRFYVWNTPYETAYVYNSVPEPVRFEATRETYQYSPEQ